MKGEISFSIWISKSKAKEKSLFMDPEFMDPELWVLLHEKLPRELSWSESERELASAQEIFHESSFSLKKRGKTYSYYSKFQSLASHSGKAAVGSEKREPWAQFTEI